MKLLRWGLIFIIAFTAAWVVIFTFNQEPFKAQVPAKILVWQTQSIPVYGYLTFAFCLGLTIGILIAFYNGIVFRGKLSRTNKQMHKLEQELAAVKQELEQSQKIFSEGKMDTKQEQSQKPSLD